jgi:hypothetical protein
MTQRKWLIIPLLLGAVAVPYALFNGGIPQFIAGLGKGSPAKPYDPLAPQFALPSQPADPNSPTARLEGPPVQDLAEVIRFDISPQWVGQYWSRVSTVTAEMELEGLRVPLVTGAKPDDLAGSLTYYFDKQHRLQRLTFHGTTGDERRLVALLTQAYGFKEQPALGGMYVTAWNGKPTSVLRIDRPAVLLATAPNASRQITLEINRPGERYGLSGELRYLIEQDAQVRRW